MASISKRKRRDGKPARKYSIKYRDEYGKWRSVVGCADLESTRLLAKKLESDATLKRNGVVSGTSATPLSELVKAFSAYLASKRNTERYIDQTVARVEKLFTECEFKSLADLNSDSSADRVAAFLHGRGSQQTANHYLTVMKTFCNWAISTRKLPGCHLLFLKRVNVTDAVKRRAITSTELRQIVKAAEKGEVVFGLSGSHRAMLYRVAANTGFRVSELASLTPSDFILTGNSPFVVLKARSAKNRQEVEQPLPKPLVAPLKKFFKGIAPNEKIWTGPWRFKAARMLRIDLAIAGVDDLDFHCLRVSYITNLARSGVHPKTAQELARHSDINLTMGYYTKLKREELAAVLPSF